MVFDVINNCIRAVMIHSLT